MTKELRQLDIQSLHESTLKAAATERQATHVVIQHLSEMGRRRGYAILGYGSLFEYCTQALKMSEGSASLHIRTARLNADLPEISNQIQNGTLTLSNLGQVQSFIKAEEKRTGERLSTQSKIELVKKVESKTQDQAKRILIEALPEVPQVTERERPLAEGKLAVTVVLSPELQMKIKRLKELSSHKNDNPNWAELIESLVDEKLLRTDPLLKPVKPLSRTKAAPLKRVMPLIQTQATLSKFSDPVLELNPKVSKVAKSVTQGFAIAGLGRKKTGVNFERALHQRAQSQCEHVDNKTGVRCTRRYHVQIDHKIPIARGGSNEFENLQLLCRPHNLLKGCKLEVSKLIK